MIRLQKYISDAGCCSRRKAEELIIKGKVKVNNITVKELGVKVDEENDQVEVMGKIIKINEKKVYIVLNKPKGYITTSSDDRGRKTVMDLLSDVPERVFPVGRLDFETKGMLILTNDGDFTYKLTHPKHSIPKTYIAAIKEKIPPSKLFELQKGVKVEDYLAVPKEVRLISQNDKKSEILITITEGKNRQVRKMFEAIGYIVTDLKRISIGNLRLNKLAEGKWRYLTKNEINLLGG